MANGRQPRRRNRKEPVLPEGVMTTSQATRELGISAATLRRWVKEGRVEAMKVGKQLRFRQADLRRVITLQSREEPPAVGAAPEAEVRRCEQALDRLLRAQGVKLEQAEADISRQLAGLSKEQDPAATRLLFKMLLIAVEGRASDVHIEPFEGKVVIRQRVDGVLTEMIEVPMNAYKRIVAQLKRWSNLDVTEKFRPQDGRVMLKLAERDIDFRLSTMPAIFGEVVAVRLLDRMVQLPDLSRLGFEPDQLEQWRRIIHSPNGLIVVNGPTGAGKTTLIYGSLYGACGPRRQDHDCRAPRDVRVARHLAGGNPPRSWLGLRHRRTTYGAPGGERDLPARNTATARRRKSSALRHWRATWSFRRCTRTMLSSAYGD